MTDSIYSNIQRRLSAAADSPRLLPADDGFGTRKPVLIGIFAMVLFFGVLGSWAVFAKLEGAIIASGVVKVEGNRKTMQHLDGGIVKELLVREGDRVSAGQTLMVLDSAQLLANAASLSGVFDALVAQEARLRAERDEKTRIEFPAELQARAAQSEVADAIATQTAIFRARLQAKQGEIAVLQQRIAQIRQQIAGVRAQMVSQRQQADLTIQELNATRELYEQGFATKNRVLQLDRGLASFEGEASKFRAEIARLEQAMGETNLQIAQVRKVQMTEVTRDLADVQTRILDTRERLNSAREILSRITLAAPIDGYVVGLSVFTVGAVINRGDRILDVVPVDAELVIEAMVRPEDIENVKPGATAEIRLTAFKQRELPRIDGTVRSVSADRLTDQKTGASYFAAQIEIDHQKIADAGLSPVTPGMPAELFIKTNERSVFSYLTSPLTDSLRHALRER